MLTVHIQDAKLREEHADSMLNLGTSQQTFLLKMKDLIDDFAIQMPAVTMQYEVCVWSNLIPLTMPLTRTFLKEPCA